MSLELSTRGSEPQFFQSMSHLTHSTALTLTLSVEVESHAHDISTCVEEALGLRDSAGPPPSIFSELMLKFEKESPSLGGGVGRKAFDFAQSFTEEINSSKMRTGFHAVRIPT